MTLGKKFDSPRNIQMRFDWSSSGETKQIRHESPWRRTFDAVCYPTVCGLANYFGWHDADRPLGSSTYFEMPDLVIRHDSLLKGTQVCGLDAIGNVNRRCSLWARWNFPGNDCMHSVCPAFMGNWGHFLNGFSLPRVHDSIMENSVLYESQGALR